MVYENVTEEFYSDFKDALRGGTVDVTTDDSTSPPTISVVTLRA